MDQLLMHVTSAIHNKAWNIVYGHAVLSYTNYNAETDLAKRPYADVCSCVAPSSLLPCLVDLCKALWSIMDSYKHIVAWHTKPRHDEEDLETSEDISETEEVLERQYVLKKLNNGLPRVWQDVQTKVRLLIVANDVSELNIDNFLRIMDVIHRYILILRMS